MYYSRNNNKNNANKIYIYIYYYDIWLTFAQCIFVRTPRRSKIRGTVNRLCDRYNTCVLVYNIIYKCTLRCGLFYEKIITILFKRITFIGTYKLSRKKRRKFGIILYIYIYRYRPETFFFVYYYNVHILYIKSPSSISLSRFRVDRRVCSVRYNNIQNERKVILHNCHNITSNTNFQSLYLYIIIIYTM